MKFILPSTSAAFRALGFLLLLCILQGCWSHPTVIRSIEKDLPKPGAYYLLPVNLGPTLANSSQISSQLTALRETAESTFLAKGYNLVPVKNAEYLLELTIATAPTGAASEDEIRFMKGTQTGGFPDANPKIRSLEADFLLVEIARLGGSEMLYAARCSLVNGQEHLPGTDPGTIEREQAEYCINQIFSAF